MAITYDDNSIHVYRGQTRKKTIYTQPGAVIRLSALWDKFAPTAATLTSTWAAIPENDSRISFASSAVSGQGVETYATLTDNQDPFEIGVKNTVVMSTGETASVSWRLQVTESA